MSSLVKSNLLTLFFSFFFFFFAWSIKTASRGRSGWHAWVKWDHCLVSSQNPSLAVNSDKTDSLILGINQRNLAPPRFRIASEQKTAVSQVPWSLPRSGSIGNPPVMSHPVGRGTSKGSPALQDLYLYSSTGSGDNNKQEGLWNVVLPVPGTLPFRLIRAEQGCRSRGQMIRRWACSRNKPCRRWNQLRRLPERRAGRCTWAYHTQTGLW